MTFTLGERELRGAQSERLSEKIEFSTEALVESRGGGTIEGKTGQLVDKNDYRNIAEKNLNRGVSRGANGAIGNKETTRPYTRQHQSRTLGRGGHGSKSPYVKKK